MRKIITVILLCSLCIFAFSACDKNKEADLPSLPEAEYTDSVTDENATVQGEETEKSEADITDDIKEDTKNEKEIAPKEKKDVLPISENTDKSKEEPKPNQNEKMTCTICVRCDTLLNCLDSLSKNKRALVPNNGVILNERKVSFSDGETVFDVTRRELKREKIHFEFQKTPMYDGVYVNGINNIYEFDAGELSGWMYKVNDKFPKISSSAYSLKENDNICWVYTCDLGRDIGGYVSE